MSYEPNDPLNNASKEQVQILGPSDYITSAWSGGTTTELASYPFGADFSSRQFLWRVSIATVGKDGTFTPFENIKRILMVLKGGIYLRHEGEHECSLLPFEQDTFSGNFRTFAKIQQGVGATNLNLMLKEAAEGEMLHIALGSGLSHQYAWAHNLACGQAVDLLYNVDGELRIRYSNSTQEFYIHPGESFLYSRKSIDGDGEISIYNTGNALANIVAVRILYA